MKLRRRSDNQSCTQGGLGKRLLRNLATTTVALGMSVTVIAGTAIAGSDNGFPARAHLPTDARATCTANISPWFAGGNVAANGWVEPANSLSPVFADFKNNTRCDFYKWGAQMFLWLTSGYKKKHVFESSPGFYNVSVETNGKRTFQKGDGTMLLAVRKGKTDEEIELGQAGFGDVLLSQKKSLVYYGLHANDGFALYTTCQKNYQSCVKNKKANCSKTYATCTYNNFPSTPPQMQAVANYAASYGYPLWDEKAMAIELKTSWVDASTVTNKSDYVLSQAVVPIFNRTNPKGPWPVKENKKKTLAMVGMHVVGTVNGHPEMIWSTFEHVNNVPDNTYVYTTTANKSATQSYNSTKSWTFLPSGAAAPTTITANGKITTANKNSSLPTSIVNTETKKARQKDIGPINNMRVDPWGNDHTKETASSIVANNTDLVSINVSVLSQLKAGDIRGNYIQTGGIWSAEGQIPPGVPHANPSYISPSYLRGSLNLANTTMETFFQFYDQPTAKNPHPFNPVNCFGCHGTDKAATEVSHIFDALQPLPKKH